MSIIENEVMKGFTAIILGVVCCGMAAAAELPGVPEEAVAELGITSGTPQMNGFVFIDGCYLPPPYTVTRKGTGLFVNRILFEQPVPWSVFDAQDAAAEPAAQKKAVDSNGDFQVVNAAAVEKPAADEKPVAAAKPKAVKSIDDLFADESPKAKATEAKDPAATPEQTSVAAPAPAQATAPVVSAQSAQSVAFQRSPEELKQKKDELKAGLDNLRKNYEQSLARGEFFFFGQRHSRLNGNYGTARALIGVLPKALRESVSPQDLLQKLNQGGIYFIDQGVCTSLFRNRNTFLALDERLKKIEENEAFEAQRRSRTRY